MTALQSAAYNGHLDVVKYLISQSAEVKKGDNSGSNALHTAAQNGHLDVVKYLIGEGVEVNTGNNYGLTALQSAAYNGHLDVVKFLTSQRAEVNKGNNDGVTALHIAAQKGHLDVVKYLIGEGAEVNKGKNDGLTALYIAAQIGHLDVVKYLIGEGAEVNKGNNDGMTALHIAAQKGHLDVVKYLIGEGVEVNTGNNYGLTALQSAAYNGHLDVVKFLTSQRAEVNKGNNDGVTALHIAAQKGHLDVLKYLIGEGAEVNTGNNDGVTALHIAAQKGHLDVVKYLISQRAEVNKGNNDGVTALHIAAQKGHLDVLKYLIGEGAEVNTGNNDGVTALYIAAQNGHLDVLKYLIGEGAEVNTGNNDGMTALEYPAYNGHLDVGELFSRKKGSRMLQNDLKDIHLAIQHGQTTSIEKVVCQGADLNVQSADGQMCLHEAIKLCYNTGRHVEESDTLRKISDEFYHGNLSPEKALVFYLLDNGAKTDVADKSGKLPIHYAKDEVVQQMILSRMKSPEEAHYYQESVNTERPNESRVCTSAVSEDFTTSQDDSNPADKKEQNEQNWTQTQNAEQDADHINDREDDLIQLEKHGITVRISKNEIYSAKEISVEVIEDVPPELELKETEAIISVGLKMSPSDAVFDSPVRVTMPHCGAFSKPTDAEICIYYRPSDSSSFTAIQSTSTSNPRCVMRERDLDIFLDHSSEFWIVAAIKWVFIGKSVICTPHIPVSTLKNEEHVVFVEVRHDNIEGESLDGYMAPMKEEPFLIRWHSGGLQIFCLESTERDNAKILEERELRYLTKQKVMFKVDTRNITGSSVILQFILKQSTTKEILFKMLLTDTATEISEGGASSPSTIPIATLSAGIHSDEAIGSGSTSETRKVTDAMLNELASHIPKSAYISLSNQLGIEYNNAQSILVKNLNDIEKATRECLGKWKDRDPRNVGDLHEVLKAANIENTNTKRPENLQVSTEASSSDFTPPPQDDPSPADNREQSKQIETQTQAAEKEEDQTDGEYGFIRLEKHDIMVRMSKYELNSAKDVNVEVIENVPPELELKETEAIISVGLKMSPSDAIFDSPVRVTMPHCGVFTKPKDAEVYIYYRKNASTGFTSIQSTNTSYPRCVVRERDLDIYVDHFSEHWIVALIKRTFIGKRVICTTYIPVSTPRNGIHVVYVHARDEDVVEEVCLPFISCVFSSPLWKARPLNNVNYHTYAKQRVRVLR
nr:ankyrin-1-like [Lytechinus pictus]